MEIVARIAALQAERDAALAQVERMRGAVDDMNITVLLAHMVADGAISDPDYEDRVCDALNSMVTAIRALTPEETTP